MILVLEPEKLTARIVLGFIIVSLIIGAAFSFKFCKNAMEEVNKQKATIIQLTYSLDEQTKLAVKLKDEIATKDSQASMAANSASQIREKTEKLETALAQCQATVRSQKTTIRIYKDYYFLTNGQ